MEDINLIYYNNFGIAFQWKRCAVKDFKKTQMVFRNTGLFLTQNELIQFSDQIEMALESSCLCEDCLKNETCRLLLLEAPNPQISFAMSYRELKDIDDLVKGTLFQLNLTKLLKNNTIRNP